MYRYLCARLCHRLLQYPHSIFSTYDHEGEEPAAVVGSAETHHEIHHGGKNDEPANANHGHVDVGPLA